MKKLLTIALMAAIAACCSVNTFAAEPAEKKTEKQAEKREVRPPFTGKIKAVDKTAKTIQVGERTFHVTDTTRIQMAGKPASLDDAKVGEQAGGQYREGENGRLEALYLRVGPKPEKKPKAVETK